MLLTMASVGLPSVTSHDRASHAWGGHAIRNMSSVPAAACSAWCSRRLFQPAPLPSGYQKAAPTHGHPLVSRLARMICKRYGSAACGGGSGGRQCGQHQAAQRVRSASLQPPPVPPCARSRLAATFWPAGASRPRLRAAESAAGPPLSFYVHVALPGAIGCVRVAYSSQQVPPPPTGTSMRRAAQTQGLAWPSCLWMRRRAFVRRISHLSGMHALR